MLNQSYFIGQASMIHSNIFLLFKDPNTYTFAPFGSHLKIETVGAGHFLKQFWLDSKGGFCERMPQTSPGQIELASGS